MRQIQRTYKTFSLVLSDSENSESRSAWPRMTRRTLRYARRMSIGNMCTHQLKKPCIIVVIGSALCMLQEYFQFEAGSLEGARARGISDEMFYKIQAWLKANK